MTLIYIAALFSAILVSIGQVMLKISKANLFSPYLYGGFMVFGIAAILWVWCLKYVPLLKLYPFAFLTFVFVGILSAIIFKEQITFLKILGALFIFLGIFFINVSK